MSTRNLTGPTPSPEPTKRSQRLFRYVSPGNRNDGEIVLLNASGRGFVIHSVNPTDPVGQVYDNFLDRSETEWVEITSPVAIEFNP